MPCSAVSVEYRRDSSAMPIPVARSLLDSDYSRLRNYNYSGSSCVRRTSNTASTSDSISKYPTSRAGLTSRSSSLTEELRDRSQTRDSGISRGVSSSRSRTSSYSSTSDSISKTSSYPSRKANYTTFDLNEFRSTYAPGNYIAGSSRSVSDSGRPPASSSLSLSRPRPTLPSKDKPSASDSANLEGNTSPRHLRNTSAPSLKKEPPSATNNHGLSGLRNIGNTCFLNSVVQCLSNTRLLREYLISREYISEIRTSDNKGSLIKSFGDVVTELWSDEGKVVNTSSFKSHIQRYAPRFMGYNQQDAQEFLRYLLEGLHDDINRVAVKPKNLPEIDDELSESMKATEAWKQYLRFDNSRIVDLFVGQLKSTLLCTVCQHASTTFEAFWDLSLPLPNSNSSSAIRLSQCLEHFTKEEVLDGHEMPTCSKCKTRRKCTKRFSIQKFPKILVLHLKRFSPFERYKKLSVTVDFPLTNLDMSAYGSTKQSCTYNLYAVSNHSGTAYSGHYTAYCLHSGSGQWFEFNDSRVSSISARNVVSSEAYILFYEQVPSVGASRL
uniref:Ubiquitin carboxyl-terminal hydrolase n=1 Tax=Lygus hesperus TaxID=30085 RepID=A0A0A9YH44_LYGHE